MTTLAFDLAGRVKWFAIPVAAALLAYAICSLLEVPDMWWWVLTVFVVALVIVLVILVVGWARRRSQERGLENALSSGGAGRVDQKAEIEALRKRWRESLATLRKTGAGGGGRRALAALPWYVIIGAPASGKSTLLRHSGVDFPIGDAALRGLQGTRNCDWWFSNVGIFLDTAGRFMSDESAKEWAEFLTLVRRQRTASPVNGVIVAIPTTDLFPYDDEGEEQFLARVDADARRIRTRLDELIDHLGINFPVWVVLTKVDLLGGFLEFFGKLDAQARARVMGWTEPPTEKFDRSRFEAQFDGMVDRLVDIRPQVMAAAPLRHRHRAFGFPDEVADLRDPLARMLQRLFEPNVFQETPFFRGFYVTSGTQEGAPLQQAVAAIRERFGDSTPEFEPESVIKQAYFVEDLVRERVVGDRAMTWTTQTEMDRGRLRRLGKNLVGCSLPVLALVAIAGMWKRADADLSEARGTVKEVGSLPPVDAAAALCRVRTALRSNKFDHLGLNAHWMVKRDAWNEEEYLYAEGVLRPLLAAAGRKVKENPSPDALPALIADYQQFRAVAETLRRIAEGPTAAPPEKAEGGEGDEGGAKPPEPAPTGASPKAGPATAKAGTTAPPGGCDHRAIAAEEGASPRSCDPPAITLDEAGLQTLDRTWDLASAAGLASGDQREGRDAKDRFRASLVSLVARHGFGPLDYCIDRAGQRVVVDYDPATDDIAAVDAAFGAAVKNYLARVSGELGRYEADRGAVTRLLDERGDALKAKCREVGAALGRDRATLADGILWAQALVKAATGVKEGAAGGAPEKGLPFLEAANAGLLALDRSGVLAPEALKALAEGAGLDRAALTQAATMQSSGDALSARGTAMAAVTDALRSLVTIEKDFPEENEFELVRDVPNARLQIETRVKAAREDWTAKVRPHLCVLAGAKDGKWESLPRDDQSAWGVIEVLHETLARDALYARLLDTGRKGNYGELVSRAVQALRDSRAREPEYTVGRIRKFVQEIAEVPATLAATTPPAPQDQREQARSIAVESGVRAVIDDARTRWVEFFKTSVPAYEGKDVRGAASYLERNWTGEGAEVRKYGASVSRALNAEWLPPDAVPAGVMKEATPLVQDLVAQFRFFWSDGGLDRVRATLSDLRDSHREVNAAAGNPGSTRKLEEKRETIRGGLGNDRERSWEAVGFIVGEAGLPPALDPVERGLGGAVQHFVDAIQKDLAQYLNGRWRSVRTSMARSAQAGGGAAGEVVVPDSFREFRRELEDWFGGDLAEPAGDVLPSQAFRTWAGRLDRWMRERADLDARGIRVAFTPRSLPPSIQGFPRMRLSYARRGGAVSDTTYDGQTASPLTIVWKPSDEGRLQIDLLPPAGGNAIQFAVWEGSDCIPRAMRNARESNARGVYLWASQLPQYAGQDAGFEIDCSAADMERLKRYGRAEDGPGDPPESAECVEVGGGK